MILHEVKLNRVRHRINLVISFPLLLRLDSRRRYSQVIQLALSINYWFNSSWRMCLIASVVLTAAITPRLLDRHLYAQYPLHASLHIKLAHGHHDITAE